MKTYTALVLTAGVLAVAAGCSSSRDAEMAVAAPMELDESVDSAWTYLSGKYDADGDGRITAEEYDRDGGEFDRLDRDRDGELTEEDYADRGGFGGMDPAMMRGMVTQRLMARYFQADDDPDQLSLDELNESIATYDADGNGSIDEAEFEAASAEAPEPSRQEQRMMRMAMGDKTNWEAMVDGVDTDADGAVGGEELVAFFNERDDGDQVWTLSRGRGGGSGTAGRPSGAPEGDMAPDFALQPPEGGETTALSSFRNNLPVALIFGSYT